MNPINGQPLPQLQPQQPSQPHRSSFSCDRHPTEQFAGFCTSCLCERLNTLDQSSAAAASSSHRPSATALSAAAPLKVIFRATISTTTTENNNTGNKSKNKNKPFSSSFFPELRRTKSFSASKNEGLSGVFEPQRKSCDVRVRNTLWSLFNLDDERKCPIEVETRTLGSLSSRVTVPVVESKEDDDENDEHVVSDDNGGDEIKVCEEAIIANVFEESVGEVVDKSMKDHIDLDAQAKKPSGFWSTASAFGEKWHKWRRKQKLKKRNTGGDSAALRAEKPISRRCHRETQSEVADYGFGRRSCDTRPRFSLDSGRISFEDPRYSSDEPRASWDGYLIGRNFPRILPKLAVVEDAPPVHMSDTQIPLEDGTIPGDLGSSRRRKSLDWSNSMNKAEAVVAGVAMPESDELRAVSNAEVSSTTIDYFQGTNLLVSERELRDSNSNSLRDDSSETFELGFRNGERKGSKKSRRWIKAWNIWGFIHWRSGSYKDEDQERYSRRNGIERSLSESWQGGGFNRRMLRSNSSVSWRNSYNNVGSFGGVRKRGVETNGNGKKRREEFVLERNRSARYSPNNIDNGFSRFHWMPMRSRRGGLGKSNPNNSHPMAGSALRFY